MIQRILLPLDDPKHMSPSGTAQLSDEQLMVLSWWIDAGAPRDRTVAELDPSARVWLHSVVTGPERGTFGVR